MIPECFKHVPCDALLYAPASEGRPSLLSNGHWLLRSDADSSDSFEDLARAFAAAKRAPFVAGGPATQRAAPSSPRAWQPDWSFPWEAVVQEDSAAAVRAAPGAPGVWIEVKRCTDALLCGLHQHADMAARESWGPLARLQFLSLKLHLVDGARVGDLGTPLFAEKTDRGYRGVCATTAVLSWTPRDADAPVLVGLNPAYYAATLLRGWSLEVLAPDAGPLDPIKVVAPGGRAVGLAMPVRL